MKDLTPIYYTQREHPKNEGRDFHIIYDDELLEVVSKTGEKHLEVVNTINIYERTQKHAESCKIENILKAAAMGDLSVLNQRDATYLDATTLPKSLAEAQAMASRMKAEFETFPSEVKELFNNSPEMYVNQIGTPEFLEKMRPYNKKMAEIQEAGSMKEYNKKVAETAKFNADVAAHGKENS